MRLSIIMQHARLVQHCNTACNNTHVVHAHKPQAVYRRDMDLLFGFLEKPLPGRTTAALNHVCPWCDIAVSSESSGPRSSS
jgi:hypothetical protein